MTGRGLEDGGVQRERRGGCRRHTWRSGVDKLEAITVVSLKYVSFCEYKSL